MSCSSDLDPGTDAGTDLEMGEPVRPARAPDPSAEPTTAPRPTAPSPPEQAAEIDDGVELYFPDD